jgi:hypothetical protein
VAPVYLKDPAHLEGLLCCHFFVLIIQALIEREIRGAMKAANQAIITLYPELRDCPSPSAERILEIFAGVARTALRDSQGTVVKTIEPRLTRPPLEVLTLLGIPASAYATIESAVAQFSRYRSLDVRKELD